MPPPPPPLSPARLALRYAAFAVVATLANLATQRLAFASAPEGWRLSAALVSGTAVGLVVKYVLDKKWIFRHRFRPAVQEARHFTLYTLTGVVTTLIFWGSETLFWLLSHDPTLREVGAVLGLAAGYAIKYRLDRRFVFRD